MQRTGVLLLAVVAAASLGTLAAGTPPQLTVAGQQRAQVHRQAAALPRSGAGTGAADPVVAPQPAESAPTSGPPATSLTGLQAVAQNDAVTASALTADGIPAVALTAYRRSEATLGQVDPGCHLPWSLVAAIGRVESNHGRSGGAALLPNGLSEPPILGPLLDGQGFALVPDTDHGRYDGNTTYDRAVGPMQFLPATWVRVGVDADHDQQADPFDINDAATAAGSYLCADGRDLASAAGLEQAVFSYNHSTSYVALVIATAQAYATGTTDLPTVAPGAAVRVPTGPLPPATPAKPGTDPAAPPVSTGSSPAPSASASPTPSRTPSTAPSTTPSTAPSGSAAPTPSCSPSATPSGSPSPTPTGSPTAVCPTPSPSPTGTGSPSTTASGSGTSSTPPSSSAGGGSAPSTAPSRPAAPTPPAAPGRVSSVQASAELTSASTAALTVSWPAATGAGHYVVQLYRVAGATRTAVGGPVSVTRRAHTFTGLPVGGSYLVTVAAVSMSGRAAAVTAANPVRLLAPSTVTVGPDGRTLQWTTPAGQPSPSSWQVTVIDSSTGAVRRSPDLPGKTRTYDVPLAVVPRGHRYEVVVQATYDDTVGIAGRATAPSA